MGNYGEKKMDGRLTRGISMMPARLEDGTWCVQLLVTGLADQQEAETAVEHMRLMLCGEEFDEQ